MATDGINTGIKLVLASAPVTLAERYGTFAGAASTEPSFGLVCLAAAAGQAGADVHIVEAASRDLDVPAAREAILRFTPDVVGISATTMGIAASARLAGELKSANPDVVVLVGGCHATALPEQTLREFPPFDLVVMREGERTLVEILERIGVDRSVPRGIAGTAGRVDGDIVINEQRPFIEDLDELPLPAWSLLRGFPGEYRPSPGRIRRWPCASVVLTRGCPNRCTFCDRSVFGNKCRAYSARYAVELLRDLRQNHGVKEVLIEDDTFVIRKERVREFCERLIAEKIHITWSCLGRANLVDRDLLKLMRRAGCWHISFGVESGDADILRAVKKNVDAEQIRRAILWSREAGLRTKGFFMLGFPGETLKSMEATRRFAVSLPLHDISLMQLTPFPGSEIYATAGDDGKFLCDWARMNTLNTVFVPNGLTPDDIEAARRLMLRSFYLRPGVLASQAWWVARNPRLWGHMFGGLGALLRSCTSRSVLSKVL